MSAEWTISSVKVQLRRSAQRRTVALQVRPGEVVLYAPQRVSTAQLQHFLSERREWVSGHLTRYAARPVCGPAYEDGAALPFLGETLTLRLNPWEKWTRRDGDDLLLPSAPSEDSGRWVEAWTRAACLAPYTALVTDSAGLLGAGARLGRVRVSGAGTRWGSCNNAGDIRLHWRLSRAPLEVLHYVALHEAAHLLELNHSARYWAQVARVMPGWQRHRRWLGEHGHTL